MSGQCFQNPPEAASAVPLGAPEAGTEGPGGRQTPSPSLHKGALWGHSELWTSSGSRARLGASVGPGFAQASRGLPRTRALHCDSGALGLTTRQTHSVKNDICPTHSQICGDICFAFLFSFITATVFRSVATSCFRRAAVYPHLHPGSCVQSGREVGGWASCQGGEVAVTDAANRIWVSRGDCPTGQAKVHPAAGRLPKTVIGTG